MATQGCVFYRKDFHFDPATHTYSAEASQLRLRSLPSVFTLIDPSNKNPEIFNFTKADRDASGEDVYGHRYTSRLGNQALIIND